MNPWAIIGFIAALGIAVAGGYAKGVYVTDAKWEASTTKAQLEREQTARATEHDWQAKLAALDVSHQKEMQDAKFREDQLRADVDDRTRQLRIAVSRNNVPGAASASGGGDGGTAELAPEARRAYFDLRASIIENQQALAACQGYVAAIMPPP